MMRPWPHHRFDRPCSVESAKMMKDARRYAIATHEVTPTFINMSIDSSHLI